VSENRRIQKNKIIFLKKKVIITGGSRGIGHAIAKALRKNFNVYITGTKINKSKKYFQLDLNDTGSVKNFINKIRILNFDILINNAGINLVDKFHNLTNCDIEKMININQKNLLLITKSVIVGMKKKNFGKIINISSIWGVTPNKYRLVYSLTKSSLISLSKSLAIEYSKYNITTNTISPGIILTDLTKKNLSRKSILNLKRIIPMQRLGKPEDISNLVKYLVEIDQYINGQNIVVDGGFTSGYEI